ncbi:glycosyltransferase family 24 protein, partial [Tortispora caseinolytica NRRL Y-17796]
ISVSLNASWNSPPYAMQVIESIAAHNNTKYFQLIDYLLDNDLNLFGTDQQVYDRLFTAAHDLALFSELEESIVKMQLALQTSAALIQTHFELFDIVKSSSNMNDKVIFHNGDWLSKDDLYALQTATNYEDPELHPFDRIYPNGSEDVPVMILYFDISDPEFFEYHNILRGFAEEQRYRYVIRYAPPKTHSGNKLVLPGISGSLYLKRTDYIVVDDRDVPEASSSDEDSLIASVDSLQVSESQLRVFGNKLSAYLCKRTDPLKEALRVVGNLPLFTKKLVNAKINTKPFRKAMDENFAKGLGPGTNALYLNGRPVYYIDDGPYTLSNVLREEAVLIKKLASLGLTPLQAGQLITDTSIMTAKEKTLSIRFDWRDSADIPAIVYINDIEHDQQYSMWSHSVSEFLNPRLGVHLPPIARNAFTMLVPFNPTDQYSLSFIIQQLAPLVNRRMPVRIAIIPLAQDEEMKKAASTFYYFFDRYGFLPSLNYLAVLLNNEGVADKTGFNKISDMFPVKENKEALSYSKALDEYEKHSDSANDWARRLGVSKNSMLAFGNGFPIDMSDESWMMTMMKTLSEDVSVISNMVKEGLITDESSIENVIADMGLHEINPYIRTTGIGAHDFTDLSDVMPYLNNIPSFTSESQKDLANGTFILSADFTTSEGKSLAVEALKFLNQKGEESGKTTLKLVHTGSKSNKFVKALAQIGLGKYETSVSDMLNAIDTDQFTNVAISDKQSLALFSKIPTEIMSRLGKSDTSYSVCLDGRLISFPKSSPFTLDDFQTLFNIEYDARMARVLSKLEEFDPVLAGNSATASSIISLISKSYYVPSSLGIRGDAVRAWFPGQLKTQDVGFEIGAVTPESGLSVTAIVNPTTQRGQRIISYLDSLSKMKDVFIKVIFSPAEIQEPPKRFYRSVLPTEPNFGANGALYSEKLVFTEIPEKVLLNLGLEVESSWLVMPKDSKTDLENIILTPESPNVTAVYELTNILVEGHANDLSLNKPPQGAQLDLKNLANESVGDTLVMANLGYFQFRSRPGIYDIRLKTKELNDFFNIDRIVQKSVNQKSAVGHVYITSLSGVKISIDLTRKDGKERKSIPNYRWSTDMSSNDSIAKPKAEINIFSVASGHLYERFLSIMTASVMRHTKHTVKFWFIENFLSPSFKHFLPALAEKYGFTYELITYKWPNWLRQQEEKQREIWGYKILFLDVMFPLNLDKVIFVDADQVVRTDMKELVDIDLHGAPYGYTPMCDSREEMEGFRFWKQGYWQRTLRGKPYHISALYVVDLNKFREMGAGDILREEYQLLSADKGSLSNLDQDLPNNMQKVVPIYSLPQEWLWCETWCSDESLERAKTIDLCNNPLTKEPKLARARRQLHEWSEYDDDIAALRESVSIQLEGSEKPPEEKLEE